jgi:hypothetical protein
VGILQRCCFNFQTFLRDISAKKMTCMLEVFDDHDLANSLTDGLGLPGDLGFPYPAIPPVFPVRTTVSFEVKWNIDRFHHLAQSEGHGHS